MPARFVRFSIALLLCVACGTAPSAARRVSSPAAARELPPPPPPARWLPLLGEYGDDAQSVILLESDGELVLRIGAVEVALQERGPDTLSAGNPGGDTVRIAVRHDGAHVTGLVFGDTISPRRALGPETGNQLVITPVRPIEELRREAMAASPPAESGSFRPSELVELTTLDSTIHLEIRYATGNNLFGTPFYSQARAFLQRPAAEALVRVSAALRARGYGLLVHDGYRPWYVTKMFWDAAPPEKHIFVADPAKGSRHNRGCAVDLTLYDRATGAPVEMPSTYDETTVRAAADYPGGTSRQRWHRDLLRHAMEAEGFTVNADEWWHFDYKDWKEYRIGNVAFEKLAGR